MIAQLQLKDKPGKIKLGQIGSKYISVLLHTTVGLVCKALLGGLLCVVISKPKDLKPF